MFLGMPDIFVVFSFEDLRGEEKSILMFSNAIKIYLENIYTKFVNKMI